MKTVTIEQVANGYVVKTLDTVRVATCITSYGYDANALSSILKDIFEPKKVKPAPEPESVEVLTAVLSEREVEDEPL